MAKRHPELPVVLTIAGSDSGGGAGIQADLKTFAAFGVHGVTAITCVTAQNPKKVCSIHPLSPATVRAQLGCIIPEFHPAACKTGMLYSAGIIEDVTKFIRKNPIPLIVDPVMVSSSGSALLQPRALLRLKELFAVATLLTPNLDEAEFLLGGSIRSVEAMRTAARTLHRTFGCAILLKGGHLRDSRTAADIFFDGREELLFSAPYIAGVKTHGTGCTYSAAISALLARGLKLPKAILVAKNYITQAIAKRRRVRSHDVLNYLCRGG